MDDRLPAILRLLTDQAEYITIEQIAELTGAGVRTIHRDMERLERSLALRGVRLERRRGYGVRLIDPLPPELRTEAGPPGRERGGEASQRPFLILLYVLAAGRWIKISELAHTLMVSDSSVGSDLSALEQYLPAGVELARQKGVGVRLEAEEYQARMLFLSVFPRIFPRHVLLHEDGAGGDPQQQPRSSAGRLLSALGVYHAGARIMRGVTAAEDACGFQFAPSFASLVYGYLFIVRRRLPERGPSPRLRAAALETPELFVQAARHTATEALGDLLSGDLPEAEVDLLARLLSAAEPADIPENDITQILGSLGLGIERVIERSLSRLEERELTWLHDDQSLLNYLRVSIAAALRRVSLGIPKWAEFAPRSTVEEEEGADDGVSSVLVAEVLREFRHSLAANVGAAMVAHELAEASLALVARLAALRRRRAGDIRVKVLCYEGLGMSAYLTSLAREVLPAGAAIDSRWERSITAEELGARYDLVITTFPLDGGSTPVLHVAGDDTPQELRRQISEAVGNITQRPAGSGSAAGAPPREAVSDEPGLSLPTVMSVIYSFFVKELTSDAELLDSAVAALNPRGDCDVTQLRADFERRESYGSLVFEEFGIQVLHCRSDAVPEPRAGVLRGGGAHPLVLVLTAPANAPASQSRVLSELVVGLSDHPTFAEQLLHGDRSEIQAALLSLFSRRALLS